MAAHQVTVVEGEHRRRFDVVLYVNGMPLGFIELKKATADGGAPQGGARPAHDLRGRAAAGVPLQRDLRGLRRPRRAVRHRVHPVRALRAVERRRRRPAGQAARRRGREPADHAPAVRHVRPRPVPRPDHRLRRVRPHRRHAAQAAGQAAPVLRGRRGGPQDHRGGPRRRPGRRGLAHPGLRQVDGNGAVRQPDAHPPVARQPDDRRPHRPDRPGRPALRHVPGQRPAPGKAPPGRNPRRAAHRAGQPPDGRHHLHHPAEVRPHQGRARERLAPPAAVRPAQRHRHRRRGAPLPLRRPQRVRPPPARRAAARHVHRVHRHPDLLRRPEHPRCLRRVHRADLRPDPGRRGRRDRPGLLRVPADRAEPAQGDGPGAARRGAPTRSPRAWTTPSASASSSGSPR